MSDYFNMEIEVDLANQASMDKLSKKLHDFPNRIERARVAAIAELETRIVDRLIKELTLLGLGGSNLASSIEIVRVRDGIIINMGAEYAMYVEFGTGLVGANNPHPNPSFNGEDWEYDVNEHGEKGWWYPTTADDPNPTKKYSASEDMWFAKTKGMPARPFMYNTWRYSRLIITKTFNKHLRRELAR